MAVGVGYSARTDGRLGVGDLGGIPVLGSGAGRVGTQDLERNVAEDREVQFHSLCQEIQVLPFFLSNIRRESFICQRLFKRHIT